METGFEGLSAEFASDALALVSRLEAELLRLETELPEEERRARARSAQRHLHTLKGNAGLVGAELLKSAVHRLEDDAAGLVTGATKVDALLRGLDVVRAELEAMALGQDPDQPGEAIRALAEGVVVPLGRSGEALSSELLSVRAAHANDLIASAAEVSVLVRQLQLALARGGDARTLAGLADRLGVAARTLHGDALRVRSVSVRSLLTRYERIVRDEAQAQGKKVTLRLEAQDLQADKSVLDGLVGALTHLVRNAVTHGVESPEVRTRAGKPAAGTLTLRAEPAGSRIRFLIQDDGAGIDAEKIRRRARELGLGAELPVDELIFEPGLSTAKLTEAAGRGVGLEAVRRDVQRLGGRMEVASTPGRGTAFELVVPSTLALERGLVFGVAGGRYAVPIAHVEEAVPVSTLPLRQGRSARLFEYRDRLVPVLAPPLLGGDAKAAPSGYAVIVRFGQAAALVVDRLGEQQEFVFEPFSPEIRGASLVSGAALAPDGGIVLRLDAEALVKAAHGREARA